MDKKSDNMKIFERIMCRVERMSHRENSEEMEFVTLEFNRKQHQKFFEALVDAYGKPDFIDIHYSVNERISDIRDTRRKTIRGEQENA